MPYEYLYTVEERYWDWTGCSFSVTVPWGVQWCSGWLGIPYPCGIIWRTFSIPYPCFVTRLLTKTGRVCKGEGGCLSEFRNMSPDIDKKITNLPAPDPLISDGDALYSIYRKGLITRHITRNGRMLTGIGLESIDDFDPDSYDDSGNIHVNNSVDIPIGNIRYSEEYIPGTSSNEKKAYLWVPTAGPVKDPGYSNGGYYVVSGTNENPLYWGGFALATFSLEHMYGVSEYSIEYARRLVRFFLASEMWEGSGYMIRSSGFFNSLRNKIGESIIQGASPEELLGTMLGLMYYLKAEDQNHPLFIAAKSLRDRILRTVSKGQIWKKYEHPFFISNEDPSYRVKHFEFPMYAIREYRPSFLDFLEQLYVSFMTGQAGRTNTVAEIFKDLPFWNYNMYLIGSILILDGNIPENKKEWHAKVFLRDFVKASITHGPDREDLEGNAFRAVVAKLAQKYLEDNHQRDSEFEGEKYRSIIGDLSFELSKALKFAADPRTFWNYQYAHSRWQHNLPLTHELDRGYIEVRDEQGNLKRYYVAPLHSSGPDNLGIGATFVWIGPKPYISRIDYWHYLEGFPGWNARSWEDGQDVFNDISRIDDNMNRYRQETVKRYSPDGYVKKELMGEEEKGGREHRDLQVEYPGLGLLFLRMLLTHINPTVYPKPVLTEDRPYSVLPFEGAEPLHPQVLHNTYRYSSKKDDACGPEQIHGNQDQALRIVRLGEDTDTPSDFVVAYATWQRKNLFLWDEKLKLKHGFISNGSNYAVGGEQGIYLDSKGTTWKRFDKAVLARTENNSGDDILILAERAEGDRVWNPFSLCFLRRKHWLRLSIWKVPPFEVGQDPNPILLDKWVSGNQDCNAVQELDMTLMDKEYVAVLFRTKHDKDRIRIFKIDFNSNTINPVSTHDASDEPFDNNLKITSVNNDIVIYSVHYSDGWKLGSYIWNGTSLVYKCASTLHNDKLLDITTVEKDDRYYIVAAALKDGYLILYSWEVNTSQADVTYYGTFSFKGQFLTKNGEEYLVGKESGWERASISSFCPIGKNGGFVIAGKGIGRTVQNKHGDWEVTPKGLKIVYGYIMDDGRPTVVASNLTGSGEASSMMMLDVTGRVTNGSRFGVITAHKTKNYGGLLFLGVKQYLGLTYWEFYDPFSDHRWNQI